MRNIKVLLQLIHDELHNHIGSNKNSSGLCGAIYAMYKYNK